MTTLPVHPEKSNLINTLINLTVYKRGRYLKCDGLTGSLGNNKLHESILIFNLPAVKTCPVSKECRKTCYARKAEHQYETVRTCRQNNLQVTKNDLFIDAMVSMIRRGESLGVDAVRVHESGDFYSQAYADKWSKIASYFPDMTFFAYTKSPYRPTGSNWNIVESILPDGSINYGNPEYIYDKQQKYDYPICPVTDKTNTKKIKCGLTCKLCQHTDHVLFFIH